MQVLGFCLNSSTVFDVVKLINRTFVFYLDEIGLEIKNSLQEYLFKILVYLSKMCIFDHELMACEKTILGSAVYFIALKTL